MSSEQCRKQLQSNLKQFPSMRFEKTFLLCFLTLSATVANAQYYPPDPVVLGVSPHGIQRGTQRTIVLEGLNLAKASHVYFDEEGVTTTLLDIERVPNPPYVTPRHRIKVHLKANSESAIGLHGFRVKTPFGTSNWVPFSIERLPEITETSSSADSNEIQKITPPVTYEDKIKAPGEEDLFQFDASSGDEFVFQVVAGPIGSELDSLLTLTNPKGRLLARSNNFSPASLDSFLGYRFTQAGRYRLGITDFAGNGGKKFYYRLTIGRLPYITEIFPLGVRRGGVRKVRVDGFNLGGMTTFELDGRDSKSGSPYEDRRIETSLGPSLNQVRIAVGEHPQTLENENNDSCDSAQQITIPINIDGRIGEDGDQDTFRLHCRQGQVLALEVLAQRLGSPLDSLLEILDASGQPVPRSILKATFEGNHPDPLASGSLQLQRFESTTNLTFRPWDFVLLNGRELVRLEEAVRHSDDFSLAQGLLGKRLAWLGTTPQNHPANLKVYKVDILPPQAQVEKGELPLFHLDYRNDDGGPVYGKDSYLLFTAPADGDYLVRLSDLRKKGGKRFAYQLTIRPAHPDFRLFLDDDFMQQRDLRGAGARNPNIPRGGRVAVTVSAHRIDGFMGAIEVEALRLPPGVTASHGIIRAEEFQTTLALAATEGAAETSKPLRIVGRASINGEKRVRPASDPDGSLNLISISPPPMIRPLVEPEQLVLQAGTETTLRVSIECPEDFSQEVGIEVKNRPPGLFVWGRSTNAGLVIGEGERSRDLTLVADAKLPAMTFPIFVVTRFKSEETEKMRGIEMLQQSADYASIPVMVTILPRSLATGD